MKSDRKETTMSKTIRTLLALAVAASALAALPEAVRADAGCDRFASPNGSDANPGTQSAPVRSIARLIEITGAGEEGCLPSGATFVEPIGTFIVSAAGGRPGEPATIRSADPDGPAAIVEGAMWLKRDVHDLTFEDLRFDGSPGNDDKGTMLVVDGDRISFRYTEMTWRRGICLNAGHRDGYSAAEGPDTVAAEDLTIEYSRIHDCGNDPDIIASLRQAGQSGVHGLYLIDAPGARIRDNYVYDNVSRGIQLWPDVDGAVVEHNVFDGNGSNINVGSSAAYGLFSEGNRFADNIVTNARLRSVYDGPWGPGDTESIVGNFPNDGDTRGNSFVGNCVYQADAALAYGGFGYTRSGDVLADPGYTDRAAADFRVAADSPCTGKGPRGNVIAPLAADEGGEPAETVEPEGELESEEPAPSPGAEAPPAEAAPSPGTGQTAATGPSVPAAQAPAPPRTRRATVIRHRRRHHRARHGRRGRCGRHAGRGAAAHRRPAAEGIRSPGRACQGHRDQGLPHRGAAR